MLETVFAKFITKYLNEYIETLNKSQMEMELWKGHAVFQNLVLLPTALSNHQIPFRVKKGTISRISLNLPWKKLNSEACIVEISDVYIIVELDPDILIKKDLQAEQDAIHTKEETVTKEDEKGTWQSLINTVIDNARVNIKNIHIRVELPQDGGIYAAGVVIPSLSLFTCDQNKIQLNHIVQHSSPKLYKLLTLTDFAIYLDTLVDHVNLNNFEREMNQLLMSRNHQFVFHPFTLECILLHTRNVPNMLKNILTISTHQLKLSFDYSQCRTILQFNSRWAMFTKRRKYAACARPKYLNQIAETQEGMRLFWMYIFRCAKQKNRPNEFYPHIALKILQNRAKYLKLYRKKEKQKKVPHPIIKKQLKTLDAKVGSQAALFLKEYASAVVQKETNIKNSGLTAFDMSELKGLLQTGDRFFEMDSFSLEMNIPAFQLELLYSRDNVLFSIMFVQLTTNIKSIKTHAEINFGVTDLTCVSFMKDGIRSIISVERQNNVDFLRVVSLIPRTTDPFSMSISLEPVTTTFDIETFNSVMEFFVDQTNSTKSYNEVQQTKKPAITSSSDDLTQPVVNINRVDAADQLQRLLYFKNHILNIHIRALNYVFPFKHNNTDTDIKFAMKNLSVKKSAVGLLPSDVPEIKMNFSVQFTIDDMMISDHCLFKKFVFDLPFSFTYYTGTEQVRISCNFSLSKVNLNINYQALKYIASAINYRKSINMNSQPSNTNYYDEDTKSNAPQEKTIIVYGKVKTNLEFKLEEVKLQLNESQVGLTNVNAQYFMDRGETNALFKLEKIVFIINGEQLIDLPSNSTEIILHQQNEADKMHISLVMHKLHFLLDLRKYRRIYMSLISLSDSFMKEADIQLNENNDENTQNKTNQIETKEKINEKEKTESAFDFMLHMDGTEFEIPDLLGNYTIFFDKIKLGETIKIEQFGMKREGRQVVSPTTLSLDFNDETIVHINELKSQIDPSDIWAVLRLIDEIKYLISGDISENIEGNQSTENDNQKTVECDDIPSIYRVNIDNSFIDLYDKHKCSMIVNTGTITIVATLRETDLKTDIKIHDLNANQIIGNGLYPLVDFDPNKNVISIEYYCKGNDDRITMNLPNGQFYLTNEVYRYAFKWVPPDDKVNEISNEENKIVNNVSEKSSIYDFRCQSIDVLFINGIECLGHAVMNNLLARTTFINDDGVNFEAFVDDIHAYTNFKDPEFNFINIPNKFYFKYYNDCIKIKSHYFQAIVSEPMISPLLDFMMNLVDDEPPNHDEKIENEEQPPSSSSSSFKLSFGFIIDFGKIDVELFPSDFCGPHCNASLCDLSFALKAEQRLSALIIKSLNVDVKNANPDRALAVNGIKAIMSFNDLERDISQLNLDYILSLSDIKSPTPFSFDSINGSWSVENVSISYTHRFAEAIVHNFLIEIDSHNSYIVTKKIEQRQYHNKFDDDIYLSINNEPNKPSIEENDTKSDANLLYVNDNGETGKPNESNNTSESNSSTIVIKSMVNVDLFKIGLFLIDPLATIEFLDFKANLNENIWCANVRQFNLYNAADTLHSLIESPHDADLVKFVWEKNNFTIDLVEMTANINYLFYLNVVNFILRSPLLHIPSSSLKSQNEKLNLDATTNNTLAEETKTEEIQTEETKTEETKTEETQTEETKTEETKTQSEISSFSLNIKAPKLRITIPTSIEQKDYPLFHIDLNVFLTLANNKINAKISNMTLHFYDQIAKVDYVPILEKASIIFTKTVETNKITNNSLENINQNDDTEKEYSSLYFKTSNAIIKLSAIDFVLFSKMSDSIQKATSIITFSEDTSEEENTSSLMGSFSSLKFDTGQIRVIICKDNRSSLRYIPMFNVIIPPINFLLSTTDTVGSMNLTVKPYIEYYNETTGFWDMIFEPFAINAMGILTNKQFHMSFRCLHDLNINLPATAVSQYINLASEIKQSMMQIGEGYKDLPNFWIENCLGEDALFKIGTLQKEFFVLNHMQRIPVFKIQMSTEITIQFKGETVMFTPIMLTFPLLLNETISVIRKPYQGGIILQVKAPIEIHNKLSFDVDIFTRLNKTDQFSMVGTVESKSNFPLSIGQGNQEFLFTEHDTQTKIKHQIVILSRSTDTKQEFKMGAKNKIIKVFISVKTHISTGTRLFSLFSPIRAISHLPLPLHVKFENEPDPVFIHCEQTFDLYVPDGKSKFKISASLDGFTYGPFTKVNMKSKDPQRVYVEENSNNSLAIVFDHDEDTNQTIASFYSPVGLFNFSSYEMNVFEHNENIIAMQDIFSLWCPKSYFSKKNLTMNIQLLDRKKSIVQNNDNPNENDDKPIVYAIINDFDCTTPRTSNLFAPVLNSIPNSDMINIALRYDVSIKSQASIITFSPLLHVKNQLDVNIALQPINNKIHTYYGDPYLIKSGENINVSKMTVDGTFMLSIFSYSTTPVLTLIAEQRTVFKMQSQDTSILIDVEVVDVGTNFECIFKKVIFPTPIVICNCLPVTITAFQLYNVQPFVIESHSTSMFAFDEPLAYPAAYIFIDNEQKQQQDEGEGDERKQGDQEVCHMHISLVEDTDYVQTNVMFRNKPIFVCISKVKNGSRTVTITTKIPEILNKFTTIFSMNLSRINISLIDFQMRELALIAIDNFSAEMQSQTNVKLIKLSIGNFQIDDQDPKSPSPVVLYGRKAPRAPFLSFSCLIPTDTPFLTNVTYSSIVFQRIDVELDSTFVSDLYYTIMQLTSPIKSIIQPQLRTEKKDSSEVITFNWLEMSPIYLLLAYARKSGRIARVHKMYKYLKFIPSLSHGKMLLPGIVSANISNTMSEIQNMISDEYKTHAFKQIIAMLGSSGRFLTTFGVDKIIAEILGVKMKSDLSNDMQQFLGKENEAEYDNRRNVNGAFSQQSLDTLSDVIKSARLRQSDVIVGIKSNQDIGIVTKAVTNNGGGQGVFGVLTKTPIDTLNNVKRMEKAQRSRIPRAYPNNIISTFDSKISAAQNLIQLSDSKHRGEMIRMTASSEKKLLCISDYNVFMISDDFTSIEKRFEIKDINSLSIENNMVYFSTLSSNGDNSKKQNANTTEEPCVIHTETKEDAMKIYSFLHSQKITLKQFGFSLLL
ncbi:hypothetical protein TRFO_15940 [Tritrichomonas foetus]|uniref:SURP motif domain-containing protein n=1 Tax=Tritrichomonas foetus TaxID=1144522 RepID=A0A1J4KRU4_9EUKA|nr:hypothetical protein TRFO_15940 [Tritrichomonas foetus]|eukprot:OHT13818.1 hypothetical protein TRFO_15940 [Tritrichomonas foetus]